MGTRRADRIARGDADQLLAGQPAGPSHAGLAALLSDAAAPPRRAELAGEADAVAAFRRLRSTTPTVADLSTVDVAVGGGRHRVPGLPWRGATIRLAVAVVLLAGAGTASVTLAFRPARTQPTPTPVASSTVPAPSPSLSPSRLRQQAPSSRPASPSPASGTASFVRGTGDLAMAARLCEALSTATDKVTRDLLVDQLRPLIDRLGGPNGLPAFCRKLVEAQPTATPSGTASDTAKVKPQPSATAPATAAKVTAAKVTAANVNAAQLTPAAFKSTKAKKGG